MVWARLKQPLLQILVVVANIQMRTLKTEVEKGSMWTAIGHGLVDPKWREKCQNICHLWVTCNSERESGQYSWTRMWVESGNTSKISTASGCPKESFLFFLTDEWALETAQLEIRFIHWERQLLLNCFGALPMALEKLIKWFTCTPGRTHNRIRSPRYVASSQ